MEAAVKTEEIEFAGCQVVAPPGREFQVESPEEKLKLVETVEEIKVISPVEEI